MSVSINGTNGLVFSDGTSLNTSPFTGGFQFRNRIINGAMQIDQRNAGASVTPTSLGANYVVDRWFANIQQPSKFSVQQNAASVTPPAGFSNYLGATILSAYTPGAAEVFLLQQNIEGVNTADFSWGTASASAVTLSFWVRSSLTGTFGGSLFTNAPTSWSYPFSYTISAANTWEQKTITIPGATSGTWNTNNSSSMGLIFSLGTGSNYQGTAGAWVNAQKYTVTGATSVVGTLGATFYITGVQLEKGSTATSFDYRPYGTELALCQRYYEKSYDIGTTPGTATTTGIVSIGAAFSTSTQYMGGNFSVSKRAAPTMSYWDAGGNVNYATYTTSSAFYNGGTQVAAYSGCTKSFLVGVTNQSGYSTVLVHYAASSEL